MPVLSLTLGFVIECKQIDGDHIAVSGDVKVETLKELEVTPERHRARHYTYGLFEGFVAVMSGARNRPL